MQQQVHRQLKRLREFLAYWIAVLANHMIELLEEGKNVILSMLGEPAYSNVYL